MKGVKFTFISFFAYFLNTSVEAPMIHFTNEIQIDQPISLVYDYLSAFENIPHWNYYVQKVAKVNLPNQSHDTYHQIRDSDEQYFEVVENSPCHKIEIKTIPGSSLQFHRTIQLKAVDDCNTLIIDDFKVSTRFPSFLERLFVGKIKGAVYENLLKLKELLESGMVTLQDHSVHRYTK